MKPQTFGRLIPAVTLAVILAMLALHHWNVVANKSAYASAVLLLTPIGGLALGGTIYPPLFYSVGRYGRGLPSYLRVFGGLCAAAGLAAGFYLLFIVYAF
jgi:CDP-diglyceride synthetase